MTSLKRTCLLVAAVALAVAACDEHVEIENKASIPIRATVDRDSFLVESGGYRATPASLGSVTVTVVSDADWVAAVTKSRNDLVAKLGDPADMTPTQIKDLVKQIKALNEQVDLLSKAQGASCSATVVQDGGVTVVVTGGANGDLTAACTATAPSK
jgi:hypothetical protein